MAKLHRPHAGLLLIRNDKRIMLPLTKEVTTIGRKQADILLDDPEVSSQHVELRRKESNYFLKDLKSTSGTFVNQQRVDKVQLIDQDVIKVGQNTFCFFADSRDFLGVTEMSRGEISPKEKKEDLSDEFTVKTAKKLSIPLLQINIIDGPDEGKSFSFRKSHITIGRNDTDIVLLDIDSSRKHALLEVLGNSSVYLRDLNSTNGTFLNGKKIKAEKINSGAMIKIGDSKLQVIFT